jgi:drug/metabolite transporter (DMT)-like permease
VFTSFQDPDLASRARTVAGVPGGAFLLTQIYFTLYPLLSAVPRWLFEGVRTILLTGTVGGLAGILFLIWHGLRRRRESDQLDGRAAFWLALALGGVLACGFVLFGMSVPHL